MVSHKFIGKHLKIFIKTILRRGFKNYRLRGRSLLQVIAQEYQCRLLHIGKQTLSRGQCKSHFGRLRRLVQSLAAQFIDTSEGIVCIGKPIRRLTDKLRQRHTTALRVVDVGDDIHLFEHIARKLTRQFKTTNRVYLIIKEIKTVRLALRVGEDVENSSSPRILPRLIDKIHTLKAECLYALLQSCHLNALPALQVQRLRRQTCHIRHRLQKSLRIGGYHKKTIFVVAHRIQHSRAHNDTLGIFRAINNRAFICRREE